MKIVEKKKIEVEAYYARCGPMVLRRCRRLLQFNEKESTRKIAVMYFVDGMTLKEMYYEH
jgi:hypothetical protein